ncbi:MAG: succinate dehydrogenase, partial [Pseudomonadota bacterium]|nr:succinate dehydrogenase [Pseudomonadota bacterium]
ATLGLALKQDAFAGVIAWTANPLMKGVEALLVAALAVHFAGGVRLLAIEFFGLSRSQGLWIASAFAAGVGGGLIFLLAASQ